mmetsp:Transcript_1721/g.6054  ORF Transcript_1721/g.6054 Transcript_1721/m.6054 type:complete len:307 (+) Transcript_1721:289-1209(+)
MRASPHRRKTAVLITLAAWLALFGGHHQPSSFALARRLLEDEKFDAKQLLEEAKREALSSSSMQSAGFYTSEKNNAEALQTASLEAEMKKMLKRNAAKARQGSPGRSKVSAAGAKRKQVEAPEAAAAKEHGAFYHELLERLGGERGGIGGGGDIAQRFAAEGVAGVGYALLHKHTVLLWNLFTLGYLLVFLRSVRGLGVSKALVWPMYASGMANKHEALEGAGAAEDLTEQASNAPGDVQSLHDPFGLTSPSKFVKPARNGNCSSSSSKSKKASGSASRHSDESRGAGDSSRCKKKKSKLAGSTRK